MTRAHGAPVLDDSRVGLAVTHAVDGRVYDDQDGLRALIRTSAIEGGLGRLDPASPLRDIIFPGASVLLKPNWVLHYNQSGATMDCMVTHPAFILAVLAEVVAAGAGRVLIADAPIQSAQFDLLAPAEWRGRAAAIAGAVPLAILDFRNVVSWKVGSLLRASEGQRARERFVEFNLGEDSLLEPISTHSGAFRNTSYNPDEMAAVQGPGVHRFLLCKEPFEVDVILNLPKLKAHAKAGVTAALKNLVGVNGDKNYLPHHRVGGSSMGGDCYEGLKPFKRLGEALLDGANRRIGKAAYVPLKSAGLIANALHGGDLEGKWWGNDTTWRMVLDLNRILLYGNADGTMSDEPQRRVFSITDALIAGQRNGPLAPEPIALGAVTFAANSAHADAAHVALMRFDAERIALVREAFGAMRYPITSSALADTRIHCDGTSWSLSQAAEKFGRGFRPPDLWVGHVEGRGHSAGESMAAGQGGHSR